MVNEQIVMNIFRRLFDAAGRVDRSEVALRVLAVFQLLLMFATLPLWLQSGHFPVVRFFHAGLFPEFLLPAASGMLGTGCMVLALFGSGRTGSLPSSSKVRRGNLLVGQVLAAGVISVAGNQQCLQAWHAFFLWGLTSFFLQHPQHRLSALRQLMACVYVCSGLSRVSLSPESGPTGMILGQLAQWLPEALSPGPTAFKLVCQTAGFAEAAIGLLLIANGRLRATGAITAFALHVSLLLALGPLGLNHHAGVLLWNLSFLFLIPLVCRSTAVRANETGEHTRSLAARWLKVWSSALWLCSLAGLVGLTDAWPAWQLYSPRPEQWQLWISRERAADLRPPFNSALSQTSVDGFVSLRLDLLSLMQTRSPLYPEDRFQLAIIESVLQTLPEDTLFVVRIDEPVVFPWWQRHIRELRSRVDLVREHQRFLFNSWPSWPGADD